MALSKEIRTFFQLFRYTLKMMKKQSSFRQNLANNSLAVISLVIAITALTYNSWRANTSEENRNLRFATFQMIIQLGELQNITNELHFNGPAVKTAAWQQQFDQQVIEGWGKIALIEDLSTLLPDKFHDEAMILKAEWQTNATLLGTKDSDGLSKEPEARISSAIHKLRQSSRMLLKELS